jgi:hypothetical protein
MDCGAVGFSRGAPIARRGTGAGDRGVVRNDSIRLDGTRNGEPFSSHARIDHVALNDPGLIGRRGRLDAHAAIAEVGECDGGESAHGHFSRRDGLEDRAIGVGEGLRED